MERIVEPDWTGWEKDPRKWFEVQLKRTATIMNDFNKENPERFRNEIRDILARRLPKSKSGIDDWTKGKDFFFVKRSITDSDKELFFGPLTGNEEFIVMEDNWTMAHILVQVGLFSSLSQARKQKEDVPIPSGFTDLQRGKGKNKKFITILNTIEGD